MSLQIITAPAAEPIHVAEARLQVKQDVTDDDSLLLGGIGGARSGAETYTQRQLIAARWLLVLDGFPNVIKLPKSPLIQVVSVKYVDMNGVLQTVPSTDYIVDAACDIPKIAPVFGKIWPIALPQLGAVQVLFDAGYAAPITANAGSDSVAINGWRVLAVGEAVRFSNSGGALPAPLQVNVDYYIRSVVSAGVYTLAASAGGALIDLTDVGSGQSFLGVVPAGILMWMRTYIASLYEHRGQVAVVKGRMDSLPYIKRLLDDDSVITQ